ncbi:MAG: zinc ribbon domain-containing protein [Ruminococcaceae bacterium]|nr:zinc ribbon domain-containing protein [Oscillospiraceae bacterium]
MFCINCGIELSDGQKICPICQTRVYHPDLKKSEALPTYPRKAFKSEEINIRGLLFVITLLHLIPIIFAIILDYNLNNAFDWTGYVVGAVLLIYVCAVLPMWFKRANPVIFTPCAFFVAIVYLWYINFSVEGDWFWSFAFPVSLGAAVITTALVTLLRYVKKHRLYIVGGAFILTGVLIVFIEFFLHLTFDFKHDGFIWSLYPLVFLAVIGIGLIVIEIVKPFKESLRKIFFL